MAGVHLTSPELLTFHGNPYVDFQLSDPVQVLENYLSEIKQQYLEYLRALRRPVPPQIQVVLGFPPLFDSSNDDSLLRTEIINYIQNFENGVLNVILKENLSHAFVRGIRAEDPVKHPTIVLDALDDYVVLYYGSKIQANGQSNLGDVIEMKDLGFEAGHRNVLDQLISAFERSGLNLDEYDRSDLDKQVTSPMRNGTYTLIKSNDIINITARANISEYQYNDLIASERDTLKSYITREVLEEKGIRNVVLMGDYLKNPVLKEFFTQNLEIEDKILVRDTVDKDEDFKTIVAGLNQIGIEEIKAREEAERRRREEEERRRQEEIRAQAERDGLMAEIRERCVDRDQQAEYEEIYIQRGERLGLPKEVVRWNIQEALKIAMLKPETASQSHIFRSQELVTSIPDTAANIPPETQEPVVPAVQESEPTRSLPSLTQLYEIRGVLPDTEFTTKKIFDNETKETFVLRMLPSKQMAEGDAWERFKKLYNKELKYYGELSDIKEVQEGKYYLRPFFERNTLRDFVRKTDLYNKGNIDDLSSSELKLVLQVMKEVSDLQVSHADLNENNILVIAKRKWGLQRDVMIRLVGFTSQDMSKEQMENQLHEMWGRLLGDEFYREFRKRFNI